MTSALDAIVQRNKGNPMLLKFKPSENPKSQISVSDQVPKSLSRFDIAADEAAFTTFDEGKILSQERKNQLYSYRLHHIFLDNAIDLSFSCPSGVVLLNVLEGSIYIKIGKEHLVMGRQSFRLFYFPGSSYQLHLEPGHHVIFDCVYATEKLLAFSRESKMLQFCLEKINNRCIQPHAFTSVTIPPVTRVKFNELINASKEIVSFRTLEESIILDEVLKRYIHAHLGIEEGAIGQSGQDAIRQLGYYLINNATKSLCVEELAEKFNYTTNSLLREFKHIHGTSLRNYHMQLRIKASLELVGNPKITMAKVAEECGFYDQAHFTRRFKDVTGLTPSQYREQQLAVTGCSLKCDYIKH